jgi:hypothetical protein
MIPDERADYFRYCAFPGGVGSWKPGLLVQRIFGASGTSLGLNLKGG